MAKKNLDAKRLAQLKKCEATLIRSERLVAGSLVSQRWDTAVEQSFEATLKSIRQNITTIRESIRVHVVLHPELNAAAKAESQMAMIAGHREADAECFDRAGVDVEV
jgi:hypothetical protein